MLFILQFHKRFYIACIIYSWLDKLKMKVGDIIFAKLDDGEVWPGKIQGLSSNQTVKVRLYRYKYKTKSVQVVKRTNVEPFNEASEANYLKKRDKDKLFFTAVKQTKKRLKKNQDANVKQEQYQDEQNFKKQICKQNEDGENAQSIKSQEQDRGKQIEQIEQQFAGFPQYLDSLAINTLLLNLQCDNLKHFTYKCSFRKEQVTEYTRKHLVFAQLLKYLLVEYPFTEHEKRRLDIQHKVTMIVNSSYFQPQRMIGAKMMTILSTNMNILSQKQFLKISEKKLLALLQNLHSQLEKQFRSLLEQEIAVPGFDIQNQLD